MSRLSFTLTALLFAVVLSTSLVSAAPVATLSVPSVVVRSGTTPLLVPVTISQTALGGELNVAIVKCSPYEAHTCYSFAPVHILNPANSLVARPPIPVGLKAGDYTIEATYTDQHGMVKATSTLTVLPLRPCDVIAC